MNLVTSNRRLLKLASFLRELPRNRFNYSRWVDANWQGKADLSCGTSACALGWATTMPTFRRLGLRLKQYSGGGYVLMKKGDGETIGSIPAASEVFGITWDQATHLFIPAEGEERATPKQVAKKIERFVAGR